MNRKLLIILCVTVITLSCGVFIAPKENITSTPSLVPFTETSSVDIPSSTAEPSIKMEDMKTVDFSLDEANFVRPEDILEEISFYGHPGGGGPCFGPPCNQPQICTDPRDTLLPFSSEMLTCGWDPESNVTSTVLFPNGKVIQQLDVEAYYGIPGMISLEIDPFYNDPEGLYTLQLSDGNYFLESNVYYRKPLTPIVKMLSTNQLFLHNFLPDEEIHVVIYNNRSEFLAIKEYMVDGYGNLIINISDDYHYFVLDSNDVAISSPQIHTGNATNNKLKDYYNKNHPEENCPSEVILSQFAPPFHDKALVVAEGLTLYSQPRQTARQLVTLPKGAILDVVWEVSCRDGYLWLWGGVEFTNNENYIVRYHGYIIERDPKGKVYIEILPATK